MSNNDSDKYHKALLAVKGYNGGLGLLLSAYLDNQVEGMVRAGWSIDEARKATLHYINSRARDLNEKNHYIYKEYPNE